jgi:MFS family permease
MLAVVLGFAVQQAATDYAGAAFRNPGTLPGGLLVALLITPAFAVGITALPFMFLLFPDGRLPSPRWRVLGWAAVICGGLILVILGASPQPLVQNVPASENPIGAPALRSVNAEPLFSVWLLVLLLALISLLFRFRRARGDERQQLKWLPVGVALIVVSFLIEDLGNATLNALVDLVAVAALSAAILVAILKYRLYDIDRLINRTLVYGLLTALLAGVYAGAVLVLGQLFGGVGRDPPSWAVAGATLAVAALFQPARRRIQTAVDQRFNRRKYDTAKTVETFSTRLRDEIDLDTLSAELLGVVDQTMQPSQAWLWLRPSTER